jgi:hypothetical protein
MEIATVRKTTQGGVRKNPLSSKAVHSSRFRVFWLERSWRAKITLDKSGEIHRLFIRGIAASQTHRPSSNNPLPPKREQ